MIQLYKKEILTLFVIFLFKILILTLLPLTGDEAYFIKWAQNLSLGYYDHPPMVGWVIHFMSYINGSHIFFRFFAVLSTFAASFVIYKIALLHNVEKQKAFFVSLVFLSSPIDLLLLLMTNDVPLLFFSSLGTLFFLYSLEKKEWFRYALLAAIFLGSAFLSKYFAVFLMFSLLVFSIYIYGKKAMKTVVVVTIIVSLFISQNLYFNYNSCWNNIMFNFFARTEDSKLGISTVVRYFGFIFYLLTPWGIYFLYKNRYEKTKLLKLLLLILGVAFLVFLTVSLKNNIGLHWFLLFTPYMFLLFSFLDEKILRKLFKYNVIFTTIHIALVTTILLLPTALLKNYKKYSDVVMYTETKALCSELEKLGSDKVFTTGYSSASLLSYYCKKDIKVLFNSSKYGRLDDKLLDIRALSNKDIIIFDKNTINKNDLKENCSSYELNEFVVSDAKFYTAKCKEFNYDAYKKMYLDRVNKQFYNIPKWLPVGDCYFKERYYK